MLKLSEDKNIFYPSSVWPFNNQTTYKWRQSDKLNYEFEKKMIKLLSNVNKRVIYKDYPMRGFIDPNPIIDYAKSFKNIKVINERYDFRFVSSVGDIFILGNMERQTRHGCWVKKYYFYVQIHIIHGEEGKVLEIYCS